MARIKFLFFALFFVLLSSAVIADCSDDYSSLKLFYEASANEDYSSYISLMDTDYIYSVLASEVDYKTYVESAWAVYDVIDYSLTQLRCVDLPSGSLIFFNVDSTISMNSEQTNLNRDYVAVFENGKLQFVTDLELFSLHQSQAYMLQYYNVTSDIVKGELALAESVDSFDLIDYSNSSNNSFWWIIVLLIIVGILFLYISRRNKSVFLSLAKFSKNKKKKSTLKLSFLNKLCLLNLVNHYKTAWNNNIKPSLSSHFNRAVSVSKKTSKIYYNKAKVISKDSYVKIKPQIDRIKPKLDKSIEIGRREFSKVVEKSKPVVSDLSKKTAKLARDLADKLDDKTSSTELKSNSKKQEKTSRKND